MNILLALTPFIAFGIIDRIVNTPAGLIAGAVLALLLICRDWLFLKRQIKLLEVGTVILFVILTIYAMRASAAWTVWAVRLRIDAGLVIIILVSMAIRKPFTLQYAREQIPPELWNHPEFVRANYVISIVWTVALTALVLVDLAMVYVPSLPQAAGVVVTLITLAMAARFTTWYPARFFALAS
jgi:hypothetical protein